MPQPKDKQKVPSHYAEANKLRKLADSLEVEQYVSPEGRSGALKLLGKLHKWQGADSERAEDHASAIQVLRQIAHGNRLLAEHLERLPADYNPGTMRRAKKDIEPGLPVRVIPKDVPLFSGLLDDPECLKVISLRNRQACVETVTQERFWIDKKHLEVIE